MTTPSFPNLESMFLLKKVKRFDTTGHVTAARVLELKEKVKPDSRMQIWCGVLIPNTDYHTRIHNDIISEFESVESFRQDVLDRLKTGEYMLRHKNDHIWVIQPKQPTKCTLRIILIQSSLNKNHFMILRFFRETHKENSQSPCPYLSELHDLTNRYRTKFAYRDYVDFLVRGSNTTK